MSTRPRRNLAARPDGPEAREREIDEASRARIVQAVDEARRQLERDLHDGAQQRLVLAALTLGRARAQVQGTRAEPLIDEAFHLLQQALAELRDLARGMHPPLLSERGLPAALDDLVCRSLLPVKLDVTRERAAPAPEAAIYFTVAEALTNVVRHANATCASVEIDLRDGVLTAEVADDGVGGASTTRGTGLRGLADRLDALGRHIDRGQPSRRRDGRLRVYPASSAPSARRRN